MHTETSLPAATRTVEHIARINDAPFARRVTFWAALLLGLHGASWVAAWVSGAAAGAEAQDMELFNRIISAWMALLGVAWLLGRWPAPGGRQARWSAHLFIMLYPLPVVALAYLFNTAAMLGYIPVVVLFAGVAFDEHVAATGLCWTLACAAAVIVLEGVGGLPAAHEALQSFTPSAVDFAMSASAVLLLQTFIAVAVFCVATLSAGRLRQQRLMEMLRLATAP